MSLSLVPGGLKAYGAQLKTAVHATGEGPMFSYQIGRQPLPIMGHAIVTVGCDPLTIRARRCRPGGSFGVSNAPSQITLAEPSPRSIAASRCLPPLALSRHYALA
jgi:hypothetical protein